MTCTDCVIFKKKNKKTEGFVISWLVWFPEAIDNNFRADKVITYLNFSVRRSNKTETVPGEEIFEFQLFNVRMP